MSWSFLLSFCLLSTGIAEPPEEAFRVHRSVKVPENPHGIAFSKDGREVYLVSSRGQALTVLSYKDETVLRTFELSDTPLGIVLTPDGRRAVVSHFGADRLSLVNLASGAIEKTARVGPRPSLFISSPGAARAFVSCEGNDRVYEISLEPFEVLGGFDTGRRPFPPALSRDGRWLFVPGYDSGDVTVVDLLLRRIDDTVAVGKMPSGGAVLPGDKYYAAVSRGSRRVDLMHTVSHQIDRSVTGGLGKGPFSLVLSPNGRLGFVNNTGSATVSVLDIEALSVTAQIDVGLQPIVMAVHPKGKKLYVSCEGSHELAVVSIPKKHWGTR